MRTLVAVLAAAALLAACGGGEDECAGVLCTAVVPSAIVVQVYGDSTAPPDASLTLTVAPDVPPANLPFVMSGVAAGAYGYFTVGGGAGEYAFELSAPGFQPASRQVVVPAVEPRTCCAAAFETQLVEIGLVPQ